MRERLTHQLTRRRRFLAGLVALGALGPAALAQSPRIPDCRSGRKSINPDIKFASGRVEGEPTGFVREKSITLLSTAVQTPDQQSQYPPSGRLTLTLLVNEPGGSTTAKLSLTSPSRIHSRSLPPEGPEIEIIFAGDKGTFSQRGPFKPWIQYQSIATFEFTPDLGVIEDLTRRITASIYVPSFGDASEPFATFIYEPSTINEALALASDALGQTTRHFKSGACKTRTYAGGGVGACFLTTAAVETIGLADNCWELEALRTFRDDWLIHQPRGKKDIALYEREAPAIAERLRTDPKRLTRLYFTGILPSAVAARLGLKKTARRIYAHHMRRLVTAG